MLYGHEIKLMADRHTNFIIGLLKTIRGDVTIETCEYLCKEVFAHAWKHAEEYYERPRNDKGQFMKGG